MVFNVFLQSGFIRETNADIKEIDAGIKMAENLEPKGFDYGCGLQPLNKKDTKQLQRKHFKIRFIRSESIS